MYITGLDDRDIKNECMALLAGRPIPFHCVSKTVEVNVVEIDVVKAWKEMGVDPGWSNEVVVELFLK